MRPKELKLVITFHSTSDAIAMEKVCKERQISGRLIPIPQVISAGCGLAWSSGLEEREHLKKTMQEVGISEEDIHECMV